ncbi:MAG: hypothetical protein AB7F43_06785 [Bacteriovoracia bacterium]
MKKFFFVFGLISTVFLSLSVNRSQAMMASPNCYSSPYCSSGLPFGPAAMPTFISPFQTLPMFPQTTYYQTPMLGQTPYYQPSIIYGGRPYAYPSMPYGTPICSGTLGTGAFSGGSFGGTIYGSGF